MVGNAQLICTASAFGHRLTFQALGTNGLKKAPFSQEVGCLVYMSWHAFVYVIHFVPYVLSDDDNKLISKKKWTMNNLLKKIS